jgi:hypothetical protein
MEGEVTATGARMADRNELGASFFSVARSIWNMHDALLVEQRRTNALLETLITLQGGTVPRHPITPSRPGNWTRPGDAENPSAAWQQPKPGRRQ